MKDRQRDTHTETETEVSAKQKSWKTDIWSPVLGDLFKSSPSTSFPQLLEDQVGMVALSSSAETQHYIPIN